MFDFLNAILALLSPATSEEDKLTLQGVITSLTKALEKLLGVAEDKMDLE